MLADENKIELIYEPFVQKAAASKLVWGLKSKEGWANSHSAQSEEVDLIPVWSDRALAKACARDDWRGYTPVEIPLVDFLENWCMGMAESETLIGINWDANMFGVESDAAQLALDILNRLQTINSAIVFKNYSSINEFIAEISE